MKTKTYPKDLLMVEESWRNSQLSIARFYGRIRLNGYEYIIVNKEGKDLFECSYEAKKAGRDKAIEAGEPADLIWEDLRPAYKRLGRDKIIELIKQGKSAEEIMNMK